MDPDASQDEPSRKPWRIEFINNRLSDDVVDILDAEYSHDDRQAVQEGRRDLIDKREFRHCYDESQALEVLAAEPGWLHGEKFYMPHAPGFEDEDCYVQDFGLRRPAAVQEVFWRSMVDEEPVSEPVTGDLLAPGFFQERTRPQKGIPPVAAIVAGALLGVILQKPS